ncbi:sensor histidine kinase [Reinekea marinisedimentorum]|uniref:histidine kinase n=1 Tax=Reinekea marinisedimentorum TaxID=230495 RepID=A0A4R3I8Y1_9GAMM|nr:sensor histidine kinase [Reinekea marinisedimentorum]TCS40698.1 two-component system LytT family sensor kinase [Reinekea marinisedimentorum]
MHTPFNWLLLLSLFQQMSVFLVIAYLFSKTPLFAPVVNVSLRLPHKVVIYFVFSAFCILGTYFGQPVFDAIANTRAVGAVLGGLFGGPVVGTLVGLTGGLHRYSLGGFTDLACAISTTAEGLLAGMVHFWFHKVRQSPKALYSPALALVVTFTAELLQMSIILLVAKPFEQALGLVNLIAAPMLFANSIGAALFMAMIRDRQSIYDKFSSTYSAKALNLASRMVGLFKPGFSTEQARKMADIILEETGVSAVAITDRENVLAFTGMGDDHHYTGEKISAQITLDAIAENRVMFADGIETPYTCSHSEDCPLGSALVIPLRSADEVIGTVKLYESKRRLFLNINHTLGEGIARILEELILVGRYQQQKQLLTESELKLVRAQINPHFLFNALNTISAVIKQDADRARELTGDLARFLRTNLKQNQDVTTLAQELELTNSYLQIEQARFAEQLQVNVNIDEKWLDYRLPSFTIQPIVENAIKHGTSQQLEAGKLSIYIEERSPFPALIIEDNAGLYQCKEPEADGTFRLSEDGLGINIVCTRLKNMFGKNARLSIECDKNESTRVIIPLTEAVC